MRRPFVSHQAAMVGVEKKEMKMPKTKLPKSKPSHVLYSVQGKDDKSR